MTAEQRRGAAGRADGLDPEGRARLAALTRGLRALRRPPGEQSLTVEEYEKLAEVIRRLAAGPGSND
jgi:hypothetical protein